MTFVVGIDQGTTGTRTLVMSEDGIVRGAAYAAHRQIYPRDGWVEHDAEEIWRAVERTCAAAIASAQPKDVAAIGLANQGETILAWDRSTGTPLYNALVWQDTRTQAHIDALAADAVFSSAVAEKTGLRLDPYFSAPKLSWLLANVPSVRAAADANRLCLGTLDAWMIWKLTAGRAFVTDPSTAARTLLFDIRAQRYDDALVARFGVPRSALPEVRDSDGDFGVVAAPGEAWSSLRGVPIRASVVDQPAAMVGHGCLTKGDVKATYGTGCFVYLHTGNAPTLSRHGLLSTIVWKRGGETAYALDGGILAAGSVITWLRDQLGLVRDEKAIDLLVQAVGDTGQVACVPALAGLGAPRWQREARGVILGLGLGTDRGTIVKAALEGLAWQVVDVIRAMEADSGVTVKRLRADGGLTRSVALMQLQADCLGVPVEVAGDTEATGMGVCYLAARAAGLWTNDDQVRARATISRTFLPATQPGARAERAARYKRALAHVEGWRG